MSENQTVNVRKSDSQCPKLRHYICKYIYNPHLTICRIIKDSDSANIPISLKLVNSYLQLLSESLSVTFELLTGEEIIFEDKTPRLRGEHVFLEAICFPYESN